MVSKHYAILTIVSRHARKGLHIISARNSKNKNTGHVLDWYRTRLIFASRIQENQFEVQNLTKSTRIDLKLWREVHLIVGSLLQEGHCPISSQSTGKHENPKNTGFQTLNHDLTRSMISWGIRRIPSVERLNAHVIDQVKATKTDQNGLKMKNRASKEKGHKGIHKEHEEHDSQTESRRTQGG